MSNLHSTDYLNALEQTIRSGQATEHSFRPALKTFIEALGNSVEALNEPRRVHCGAPDYQIFQGNGQSRLSIGYIETKDIGANLDDVLKSDQLKRYLGELDNLLLTDYLEFRWFVDGSIREKASLGQFNDNRIVKSKSGQAEVLDLLDKFLSHQPEPIGRASDLAVRMAKLTRAIKDVIVESFKTNQANPGLIQLHASFRTQLIPHLDENQFSDMFAQTLAYGLFAARVQHQSGTFRYDTAVREIPATMPFLIELFEYVTSRRFEDEPYAGYIEDLAQILANADMVEVLRDFGKHTGKSDPVLHFYETFLGAYDPAERERRGVYYTPESVVSYIVRSVDQVLKTDFDCEQGLADKSKLSKNKDDSHRVLILDPACGTGSFLYSIVEHLREEFASTNNAGEWKDYVTEHLIPRLFGFELLMAPYAVAHFKLGLQLEGRHLSPEQRKVWGADLKKSSRLNIFLTDTLEEPKSQKEDLFGLRFIGDEVNAASSIKRDFPILIVLGNPPYSGHSAKPSWDPLTKELTWIGKLIEDYKRIPDFQFKNDPDLEKMGMVHNAGYAILNEKNPKWLQDDYVKFIRVGQERIKKTGQGILAFITNHAYLDNPTFRLMRYQLMRTFDDIYILNLHGNSKKKEKALDGGKDENVFDIQQGVAIGIFVKRPAALEGGLSVRPIAPQKTTSLEGGLQSRLLGKSSSQGGLKSPLQDLRKNSEPAAVHFAEIFGKRNLKDAYLSENNIGTTEWKTLSPSSPHYLFIPQDETLRAEYEKGLKINEIFPVNSVGIVTARDSLTIAFTKEELIERVREFVKLKPEEAREKFDLGDDSCDWKVEWAQKDLKNRNNWENDVVPILYRPFDIRWTVYTGKASGFHVRPRPEVMKHMVGQDNIGLITVRQIAEGTFDHVLVTNLIMDNRITSSNKGTAYLYPQYLDSIRLNSNDTVSIRLNYSYSILHSTNYRKRYLEFLRSDYPKILLTSDKSLAYQLSTLGSQLIDLHLLKSPLLNETGVSYPVPGEHLVEKGFPKYVEVDQMDSRLRGNEEIASSLRSSQRRSGRVHINKDQYFEGVPPEAWNFHIGGYQVLEKWLKDRRGRVLSADDREHYRKVVKAIVETIRVMKEIDEAIPGWPLL